MNVYRAKKAEAWRLMASTINAEDVYMDAVESYLREPTPDKHRELSICTWIRRERQERDKNPASDISISYFKKYVAQGGKNEQRVC